MARFIHSYMETLKAFVTDRVVRSMTVIMLVVSFVSIDIYSLLVVRDLPVMACDYDNSMISRTIVRFMNSGREVRVVPCNVHSLSQAYDELLDGKIVALVYLPKGLSDSVKSGGRAVVTAALDGSNNLTAETSFKIIATAVGTVSGGVELAFVGMQGLPADWAMAQVQPVVIDENDPLNPATNYEMYIGPPLLFFFLHLFVLVLAATYMILPRRPRRRSSGSDHLRRS